MSFNVPYTLSTTMSTNLKETEIVRLGYNQIADKYLNWQLKRKVEEREKLLEKLKTYLPKDAKVLEFGSGGGLPVTHWLTESCGYKVTAVDISEAQVELTKKNAPKAKVIRGDMLTLTLEELNADEENDETVSQDKIPLFDAIISLYTLVHIPRRQQREMLKKMINLVRPGGYILVNFGTSKEETTFDWMGVPMFLSSSDVEENNENISSFASLLHILSNDVVSEAVGNRTEDFQWVLGQVKE